MPVKEKLREGFKKIKIKKTCLFFLVGGGQGLVKGVELCLNPYFFGWLEK